MIFRNTGFFATEARRNFRRNPLITVLSIGSIAISLVALGAFLLIALNLFPTMRSLQTSVAIITFLEDGLETEEAESIGRAIRSIPGVREAVFKSKADALSEFSADPQMKEWIETVGVNPLPASFEIRVAEEANNPEGIAEIASALKGINAVEDVRYHREWVRQVFRGISLIRSIGLAFGLALCLGAVVVISNTIRLSILARQQEIYIMRLAGAESGVIRGPYVVEGFFLGLVGATCALAILYGAFLYLTTGPVTFEAFFFSPSMSWAFIASGGFLGLTGASFSLWRMLR